MAELVTNLKSEINSLSSTLLSTLDESIFFSELSKFLMSNLVTDKVLIYQVLDDYSARIVADSGKVVKGGKTLNKGEGSVGHVVRTKKSYFSNSVSKDPLFASGDIKGVEAELCVPMNCNGSVIGTIHLQISQSDKQFDRNDITMVLSILGGIEKALLNMNMYLSAKYLNESLMKQIEDKEKELEESKSGVDANDFFKIQDKEIIGRSEVLVKVLNMADRISKTDSHLLMEGKTGSGKELIARRIHCRSNREKMSFLSFDCSLYDEKQLEIELFGEESNDLSGKIMVRKGILELADGGTLFITNIDKLSANLQARLRDFLSEQMAFRVGGQVPYRADARIIASSSSNILSLVESDKFREDLYYNIGTIILKIPSLSERKEDIELLATHFLNIGRNIQEQKVLSPCVVAVIQDYSWPGNIRELRSAMERAYILSEGQIVEKEHLSENIINSSAQIEEEVQEDTINYSEMTLDELEQKHICQTLELLSGNKTRTAKSLGITVKTLYNKLHSYGMIAPKEA